MPSDQPLPGRCGSPLRKKPGQFCTEYPMRGRSRCRIHGGPSLCGAAHPGAKDLSRSKYKLAVPQELRAAHQRFLADPQTATLAEEKALTALLLHQQVQRIGTGGEAAAVGRALLDAQELAGDLHAAYEDGDGPRFRSLLGKLETVLGTGATAEHERQAAVRAEAETRKTLDLSRRIVDTETKVALRAAAVVTAEELQGIVVQLSDLTQGVVHAFVEIMKRLGIEAAVAEAEGRKVHSGFLVDVRRMAPVAEPGEVAN